MSEHVQVARGLASGLLLGAAFVGGHVLGERGLGPDDLWMGAALATGFAAAGIAVAAPGLWLRRLAAGAVFAALCVFGISRGQDVHTDAITRCVATEYALPETVRGWLDKHRRRTGAYPDALDQLDVDAPCDRRFLGTILQYERTPSGYRLWFSDWLVTHEATHAAPFDAHK